MTPDAPARKFLGLPIAAQLVALLLGVLVVAQGATLLLTLVFPPQPPPQHSLEDIARALRGETVPESGARPLIRTVTAEPPKPSGPGWLTASTPRTQLAGLLGVAPSEVRLMFYVPLPAGADAALPASPAARLVPASERADARLFTDSAYAAETNPLLQRAVWTQQSGPPSGPPPGPPPGGFPSGPPPGGTFPGTGSSGSGFPSRLPGRSPAPPRSSGSPATAAPARPSPAQPAQPSPAPAAPASTEGAPAQGPGQSPQPESAAPPSSAPSSSGPAPAGEAGGQPPQAPEGGQGAPGSQGSQGGQGPAPAPGGPGAPSGAGPGASGPASAGAPIPSSGVVTPAPFAEGTRRRSAPGAGGSVRPSVAEAPASGPIVSERPRQPAEVVATAPAAEAAADAAVDVADANASNDLEGRAGTTSPVRRGLFDSRPAGYVEGDFVAAQRLAADRWVVVQPRPAGFPNAWQARVMLWFLIAFALVAPLGWLFARRITAPLRHFADAAERLGRDPTAAPRALTGPAEIGRAARAFNDMQDRIRRYVDDRTAMIGAISHDLRTPLARMRFRLERAPDAMKPGFEADIEQMDAMITSVLAFMRDKADAPSRQRVDLRSLLEVAVDDAVSGGGDVELVPGEPAEVDVDVLGVQRVFANLLDNALKYGGRAVVRLRLEDGEAIADVKDFGPGLPEAEIESVFRPFYRSEAARAGLAPGAGLGLATTRSIVRAHGGDVQLRTGDGLTAEVRLPLAAA